MLERKLASPSRFSRRYSGKGRSHWTDNRIEGASAMHRGSLTLALTIGVGVVAIVIAWVLVGLR